MYWVDMRSACRSYCPLLIVFTLFFVLGSRQTIVTPTWMPKNVFSCQSTRLRTSSIEPPAKLDTNFSSSLWDELRFTFEAHSTHPAELQRPKINGSTPEAEARELVVLSESDAFATADSLARFIEKIPAYPAGHFHSKGIVMLAGGKYSEYAATTLGVLRETGSRMPVEIWSISPLEEREGWCDELMDEGIACRRLSDFIDINHLHHPYQYKVITMLFSSFEEILFLDADNIPIKNPDSLFTNTHYETHGAILWPDYWDSTASPWTPVVFGLTREPSRAHAHWKSVESGQILWHKQRHWRSLVLATYLNYHGPSYFYTLLDSAFAGWGDKDTFPWAMHALHEEFYQVPQSIVTVFEAVPSALTDSKPPPHGIGMVQADPGTSSSTPVTGVVAPLFLHHNIIKWSMRQFLCISCPVYWGDVNFKSHLADEDSSVHKLLVEGQRIIGHSEELEKAGVDPEPLIWKAMERTACRSRAWGNKQACDTARKYMMRVFGFEFRRTRMGSATGMGAEMCIVDPVDMELRASDRAEVAIS